MKGLLLDFWSEFDFLFKNFTTFFTNDAGGTGAPGWKLIVMWVVGIVLIYLAIKKEMEPALLLPMGFGAILVNIPFSGAIGESGIIGVAFQGRDRSVRSDASYLVYRDRGNDRFRTAYSKSQTDVFRSGGAVRNFPYDNTCEFFPSVFVCGRCRNRYNRCS